MELKDLVQLITSEVLKQLNCPAQKEVLVLLTGGRAIWPKVQYKLEELRSRGIVLKPVLSDAARQIFNSQELNRIFGTTACDEKNELLTSVKKASLIILPTLTVNTAAKMANGIQDTQITSMAGWALMMGKPVIAVTNSADPDSPEFNRLGFSAGGGQYRNKLQDNLKTLKMFGVKLVEADYLLPAVMQTLDCDPINKENRLIVEGALTTAKVQAAAARKCNIVVSEKAVITPLAREMAATAGIKISHE